MTASAIQIVFTLDNNFIQHCCVCLSSIFYSNKDEALNIHLIYDDVPNKDLKKLEHFISENGHTSCTHLINKAVTQSFKISHHVTSATYYRLFIPNIILDSEKVIYLDCDMLVLGSLRELWKIDLDGAVVGAARNINQEYFNAGTLLIDLNRWRSFEITNRCVEWIQEHNEQIQFWDQDALNAVLANNKLLIGEKWNFMQADCSDDELSIKDIRILHFAGSHKPWDYYCEHSQRKLYFKYIKATPWKAFKFHQDSFVYKLKSQLRKIFK